MAVNARNLENPERGQDLTTREGEPAPALRDPTLAELRALRERIAAAKANPPKDEAAHCRDCFTRGVTAALRAIEG